MKIGCISWSFARDFEAKKIDNIAWIKKCAEMKLDGVELLDCHFKSMDESYLKEVKKLCADKGLTVSSYAIGNSFNIENAAQLKENIAYVEKGIDTALMLGAPVIRIFTGVGKDKLSDKKNWAETIKTHRHCAEYGRKKGIVIALENHSGITADIILQMAKEINSDYFRMTVDCGNFNENRLESIQKVVHLAVMVHAKMYNLDDKTGDKEIDYSKILPIFNKAKYNGFLSIEFEGEGDEEEHVKKAATWFKKALGKI